MLMNLHCNDKMNFDDGSCCKTADKTTTLQVVTLLFFVTWLVVLVFGLSAFTLYVVSRATIARPNNEEEFACQTAMCFDRVFGSFGHIQITILISYDEVLLRYSAALYVIDGTYQKFCLRRQHNPYLPLATNNNNNGGGGGTGHIYQLLTRDAIQCCREISRH